VTIREASETLWYTRCPMATASSVAISGGWLEREFEGDGIEVRSLRANPDQTGRLAHYSHTHPALFREGGVVPPLWAYAGGAPTRLLGIGREEGFRGLIALPDSGVNVPGDLRGRRIALPRRTGPPIDFARGVAWRGIATCLGVAGLDESEVDLVDVTSAEGTLTTAAPSSNGSLYTAWENVRLLSAEVLALVRGEVDAIFVVGGFGLELAALTGAQVVVEVSQRHPWPEWKGNHLRVLTVSEDLLDGRPDLVGRYVATLHRAADWASEHQRDAIRIIAAEMGVAEEWTSLGYHPETPFHLHLESAPADLAELDNWAGFLSERGFLAGPVDVSRWMAADFLPTRVPTAESLA
jgi:ABC-type nitrate/sulfonate/bicarbonate transport system substrate-binding protein